MDESHRQALSAIGLFVEKLPAEYAVAKVILFGSRARGTPGRDSDADVAIVLRGSSGRRLPEALRMAAIAFDVLLETGVLIEALPLWEREWEHPETFSNPRLIENIRREGIVV